MFGAGYVHLQPLPICYTLEKGYREAFKFLYEGRAVVDPFSLLSLHVGREPLVIQQGANLVPIISILQH